MDIYFDERRQEVIVSWGKRGPLMVIDESGNVSQQHFPPKDGPVWSGFKAEEPKDEYDAGYDAGWDDCLSECENALGNVAPSRFSRDRHKKAHQAAALAGKKAS